jgi:hypothetical protein
VGYEPPRVVAFHQHRREYDDLLKLMDANGVGFTAMLTSLVRNDPRHLLGLSSQCLPALRQFAVQRSRKDKGISTAGELIQELEPLFPTDLARREFRAFFRGPLAYFRSSSALRKTFSVSMALRIRQFAQHSVVMRWRIQGVSGGNGPSYRNFWHLADCIWRRSAMSSIHSRDNSHFN